MSNFFDSFDTFALETWSLEGIVSRLKAHASQNDSKRPVSPFAKKVAVALMTASIGVTAAVPLPASAHSNLQWRCSEPIGSNSVSGSDVVPLNYWPGAIKRLREKKLINEDDFVDIDSPF
jgi:hypothetical protein